VVDEATWPPQGRRFIALPRDTPPERFGPLAGFVEIWRGKWRDGRLPGWSAFDFYDFTGWHGYVYVDEVVLRDPLDMRCRLWGSRLVDLLGHDETGTLFSRSPAAAEPGLREANERIVNAGMIGVNIGRATSYGRQFVFTVVKLPCAEDGETVDAILGCNQPDALIDLSGLSPPETAG